MADLNDQIDLVFRRMSDRELREVVRARGGGMTERMAAEWVGVSVKVAETRLSRWRSQHVRPSPTCDGEYGKEVF